MANEIDNVEKKKGFKYFFSESLNQVVAIREKDGVLFCKDGTTYTKEELEEIAVVGVEIPLIVHTVKKFFKAKIIFDKKGY